jgi:hypothetical protein
MKGNRFSFSLQSQYVMGLALALLSTCPSQAQTPAHSHPMAVQKPAMSAEQQRKASELIRIVRESTARFHDVNVAEAEGYALQFGCVSGDSAGAMGLHYVNGDILNKGVIDPTHPPIVIYEPTPSGKLKLIGADFLIFADAWNAKNSAPPQLMGQLFHLFDAPNRFELPSFYTLHVWAWKENPNGAFVNWHPNVDCQQFGGL